MPISFNNYARKVRSSPKRDWFEWRIFVDEDNSILNTISSVDYILHPTFPNPNRTVSDRASKFALDSYGWGEFTVYITVRFGDNTEEETTYYLDLSKPWPPGEQ